MKMEKENALRKEMNTLTDKLGVVIDNSKDHKDLLLDLRNDLHHLLIDIHAIMHDINVDDEDLGNMKQGINEVIDFEMFDIINDRMEQWK